MIIYLLKRNLPRTTIPFLANPDRDANLPYTPEGKCSEILSLILIIFKGGTEVRIGLLKSKPTDSAVPLKGSYEKESVIRLK
jgi:hypothetical protein